MFGNRAGSETKITPIFLLERGNELQYFQRFARPCRYFRTVSSTLVTAIRVTCAVLVQKLLPVAREEITTSIYRHRLQIHFLRNPENPHKTQQNREIHVEGPSVPVEICSAHQNTLERV